MIVLILINDVNHMFVTIIQKVSTKNEYVRGCQK
jgi:hypothetical protein